MHGTMLVAFFPKQNGMLAARSRRTGSVERAVVGRPTQAKVEPNLIARSFSQRRHHPRPCVGLLLTRRRERFRTAWLIDGVAEPTAERGRPLGHDSARLVRA